VSPPVSVSSRVIARHLESQPQSLLPISLLHDAQGQAALLRTEITRSALDSYLLAAGLNQVAEDYLHADPLSLTLLGSRLQRTAPGPVGWTAARLGELSGTALRSLRRADLARVQAWQRELALLVESLAETAAQDQAGAAPAGRDAETAESLASEISRLPLRLQRAIVRLPSCFRSFDQQPEDLNRLAAAFADRWPDRSLPLLVVGVRTSGSYLAPLLGVYLRRLGYGEVEVVTYRPGQAFLALEDGRLRALARAGGMALLCDDPPISGRSLLRTARAMQRPGFPAERVVVLAQLFEDGALPPLLRSYPAIVLPWSQWTIQDRLQPAAVAAVLGELLPASAVRGVERLPGAAPDRPRRHVDARYRLHLEGASITAESIEVSVRGVGLGYLGNHALAVARALQPFLPAVYGVRGGLLFRQWLSDERRLDRVATIDVEVVAGAIASYTLARSRALAVPLDLSARLPDWGAVWQRVADILGTAFPGIAPAARRLLHEPARRLLRTPAPSVIDGSMSLAHWFVDASTGSLRKVDFEERAFSNLELYSFDPAYDLAGAAVGAPAALGPALRRSFEAQGGARVDAERWLLYQLVHFDELRRREVWEALPVALAQARAMQAYAAEVWLADASLAAEGPLCGIDLDGVLETGALGFPAIGPTGALGLRALLRHGFRPLVATGRGIEEVRDRCLPYRLAGAVAEYGAVIYDPGRGGTSELVDESGRRTIAGLRATLAALPGVSLDPDYRLGVRAWQSRGGLRTSLRDRMDVLAAAARWSVRVVHGETQTDFVLQGIDKGSGLRALCAALGVGDESKPLALAVGDSLEDAPMLELARIRCIPSHSRSRLPGATVVRRPYQAGFSDAVALLIGHPPGGCPLCRPPALPPPARLLAAILSPLDTGRTDRLRRLASLGRTLLTRPSET
jgi:hypothetical protein